MARRRVAWVVAAWPGMAAVGQMATAYLHDALRMEQLVEFGANGFFAPESIRVEKGLVLPGRRPRSVISTWNGGPAGRDLLLVQGEQQPAFDSMRYARSLLDACSAREVERVVTIASLATAIDPTEESRVFAACSTEALLESVMLVPGVQPLEDAEVSGMNGEFLAAARERGIPAMCLLGEIPFFATNLPNPKASAAALAALRYMLGIDLPLEGLLEQARRIEGWILKQLDTSSTRDKSDRSARVLETTAGLSDAALTTAAEQVDLIQRIEGMFALALQDRDKAKDLKAELDRHGLFREYEDRFLDMFRKGS